MGLKTFTSGHHPQKLRGMKVVPQKLFAAANVDVVAQNGITGILYKNLAEPLLQQELFLSAHCLNIVTKGRKEINSYEGETFIIDKNYFNFMQRDVYMVSDLIPHQETFETYLFFYDDDLIESYLHSKRIAARPQQNQPVYFAPMSEALQTYLLNLRPMFQSLQGNSNELLRMKLLELLHLVAGETGPAFDDWVAGLLTFKERNLEEFMQTNCLKPLTVDDYAQLTGRSLSTFLRDFKKQFDTTPKKWLLEKKLEHARQLLHNRETTVTDVAYAIGYENISHFITAFKKRYSISPKQYLLQQTSKH